MDCGAQLLTLCFDKNRGKLRFKKYAAAAAALLFLAVNGSAYGDNDLSLDETVQLLTQTMADSTSVARKESYRNIHFDTCVLDYTVSGTYPVGDPYTIRYSAIDFGSLNYQMSKEGHDYTAFLILNFNKPFQSNDGSKILAIRTTVINVSNDEKAHMLYKAFLHLGELCGARKTGE